MPPGAVNVTKRLATLPVKYAVFVSAVLSCL